MGLGRRQGSVTGQGCSAWRAARPQSTWKSHKCINIWELPFRELLAGLGRTPQSRSIWDLGHARRRSCRGALAVPCSRPPILGRLRPACGCAPRCDRGSAARAACTPLRWARGACVQLPSSVVTETLYMLDGWFLGQAVEIFQLRNIRPRPAAGSSPGGSTPWTGSGRSP